MQNEISKFVLHDKNLDEHYNVTNYNYSKTSHDSIFFRTKELVDEITEPESESRDSNNPPKVFVISVNN